MCTTWSLQGFLKHTSIGIQSTSIYIPQNWKCKFPHIKSNWWINYNNKNCFVKASAPK